MPHPVSCPCGPAQPPCRPRPYPQVGLARRRGIATFVQQARHALEARGIGRDHHRQVATTIYQRMRCNWNAKQMRFMHLWIPARKLYRALLADEANAVVPDHVKALRRQRHCLQLYLALLEVSCFKPFDFEPRPDQLRVWITSLILSDPAVSKTLTSSVDVLGRCRSQTLADVRRSSIAAAPKLRATASFSLDRRASCLADLRKAADPDKSPKSGTPASSFRQRGSPPGLGRSPTTSYSSSDPDWSSPGPSPTGGSRVTFAEEAPESPSDDIPKSPSDFAPPASPASGGKRSHAEALKEALATANDPPSAQGSPPPRRKSVVGSAGKAAIHAANEMWQQQQSRPSPTRRASVKADSPARRHSAVLSRGASQAGGDPARSPKRKGSPRPAKGAESETKGVAAGSPGRRQSQSAAAKGALQAVGTLTRKPSLGPGPGSPPRARPRGTPPPKRNSGPLVPDTRVLFDDARVNLDGRPSGSQAAPQTAGEARRRQSSASGSPARRGAAKADSPPKRRVSVFQGDDAQAALSPAGDERKEATSSGTPSGKRRASQAEAPARRSSVAATRAAAQSSGGSAGEGPKKGPSQAAPQAGGNARGSPSQRRASVSASQAMASALSGSPGAGAEETDPRRPRRRALVSSLSELRELRALMEGDGGPPK